MTPELYVRRRFLRSSLLWLVLVAVVTGGAVWQRQVRDSQARERMPAAAEGWIQTAEGPRLSPDCMRLGKARIMDGAKVEALLRQWVTDAFAEVSDCGGKYANLAPYIREWKSHAKKMTITCTDPDVSKTDYAGMYTGDDHFEIIRPALWGVMADRGGSYTENYTNSEGKPDGITTGYDRAVEILIHEIFHSTDANNRDDHNFIETFDEVHDGVCGDNVTMDRVCVVSSLCTGLPFVRGAVNAQVGLFSRMTQCGKARGCTDVFTGKASHYSLWEDLFGEPNSDLLSDAEAGRLCNQVRSRGFCEYQLGKQGDVITLGNPLLKRFQPLLLDRLGSVLPRAVNMLPAALINAVPGARESLQKISGGACFKRLFMLNNLGDLDAVHNHIAHEAIPAPFVYFGGYWSDLPGGGHDLSTHVGTIGSTTSWAIMDSSSDSPCHGTSESQAISDWLYDFGREWYGVDVLDLYKGALARVIFRAEPGYYREGRPSADDLLKQRLARLLGPELLKNYELALIKGHATSPAFDCAAAGLVYPDSDR
ncbi:MAG TPA: hypothetical protein VL588_04510 [Bdellovibrionota bacterium]|nr:hypothetical protein [Bdellovibrionota bacterium]